MNGPKTAEPKRAATKIANEPQSAQSAQSAPDEQERIRQAAYYKWEAAGCPCSDGVDFWLEAESELKSNRPSKPR